MNFLIKTSPPVASNLGASRKAAEQDVRCDLATVRECIPRLRDIQQNALSERTCGSTMATLMELTALHDAISLPKGKFGRIALDPFDEAAATMSDEIDVELELQLGRLEGRHQDWYPAVNCLASKIEHLARREELRLLNLVGEPSPQTASPDRMRTSHGARPAGGNFSLLDVRGFDRRLDHGQR